MDKRTLGVTALLAMMLAGCALFAAKPSPPADWQQWACESSDAVRGAYLMRILDDPRVAVAEELAKTRADYDIAQWRAQPEWKPGDDFQNLVRGMYLLLADPPTAHDPLISAAVIVGSYRMLANASSFRCDWADPQPPSAAP